ncbi:Rrf2 family transcriptional regulator [Aureibaculum sp. 2210JD6-5]|uniref:RrF2 family transcriptional regulator n=1 Tax=Aureibaculum sp. 2210JD6-5 TaxID=3103957 RepID=UPI002AAD0F16|nr:Rrf2 family transcriptional regulator [Aureibaculum sp. 2210JD6-5]MDY7396688.1 Rrf2 family transcriptional regulator [Aureibaculum sp. 2210JD6-5]
MLSKSSTYAIRAVLYLSLYSNEEKKVSPKSIAEHINIPAPFLAKTLQELTKRNIISSKKGRAGGFYLTDKNKLNTLISVVDAIDGLDKFQECSLGLPVCGNKNPCPIHHLIAPLRNRLTEELTEKTIADYTKELKKGKTHVF